jgi:hypothetical protein
MSITSASSPWLYINKNWIIIGRMPDSIGPAPLAEKRSCCICTTLLGQLGNWIYTPFNVIKLESRLKQRSDKRSTPLCSQTYLTTPTRRSTRSNSPPSNRGPVTSHPVSPRWLLPTDRRTDGLGWGEFLWRGRMGVPIDRV